MLIYIALGLFLALQTDACNYHTCYTCSGEFSLSFLLRNESHKELKAKCLTQYGEGDVTTCTDKTCYQQLFIKFDPNANGSLSDNYNIQGYVKMDRGCDNGRDNSPFKCEKSRNNDVWKSNCKKYCTDKNCNTDTAYDPFILRARDKFLPYCRRCSAKMDGNSTSCIKGYKELFKEDNKVAVGVFCVGLCYTTIYYTKTGTDYIRRDCLKLDRINNMEAIDITSDYSSLGNSIPNRFNYYNKYMFCEAQVGHLCNGLQTFFNHSQIDMEKTEMEYSVFNGGRTCAICTSALSGDVNQNCLDGREDFQFEQAICSGGCFALVISVGNENVLYRGCDNILSMINGEPDWHFGIKNSITKDREQEHMSYPIVCKPNLDSVCWHYCDNDVSTCNDVKYPLLDVTFNEFITQREDFKAAVDILRTYFKDDFEDFILNDFNKSPQLMIYINQLLQQRDSNTTEPAQITSILTRLSANTGIEIMRTETETDDNKQYSTEEPFGGDFGKLEREKEIEFFDELEDEIGEELSMDEKEKNINKMIIMTVVIIIVLLVFFVAVYYATIKPTPAPVEEQASKYQDYSYGKENSKNAESVDKSKNEDYPNYEEEKTATKV